MSRRCLAAASHPKVLQKSSLDISNETAGQKTNLALLSTVWLSSSQAPLKIEKTIIFTSACAQLGRRLRYKCRVGCLRVFASSHRVTLSLLPSGQCRLCWTRLGSLSSNTVEIVLLCCWHSLTPAFLAAQTVELFNHCLELHSHATTPRKLRRCMPRDLARPHFVPSMLHKLGLSLSAAQSRRARQTRTLADSSCITLTHPHKASQK